MADSVPDPDYLMEGVDLIADEPDEPIDDFDIDANNANIDEDFHERESTPVPEDAHPRNHNRDDGMTIEDGFVVETPSVDLETMIQSYKGIHLYERLQFVIDHCPPLQRDATIALINALRSDSVNAGRYNFLHKQLESMDKSAFSESIFEIPVHDASWADSTANRAAGKLDALLGEYKKQKDEGVKESTRRAMEDLFNHYLENGNYVEALRLYGRGMREYCSQFKHIIQMWMSWLELTICANEWSRVDALLGQAERSISDAEEAEASLNANTRGVRQAQQIQAGNKNNKQLITNGKAKTDAISGMNKMIQGKYKAAADKLVKVDVDNLGLPWLITGSDLAVYVTLLTLATFDRLDIKKKVLSDSICRKFLEAEPRLVELLQCFVRSSFGRCFDLLKQLKDRFLLDPYICRDVDALYRIIRARALVQYLEPYSSAELLSMAAEFRTTVPELEDELVKLIEGDKLMSRIDAVAGVIRNVPKNERQETYTQIVDTCNSMIERTELTLVRALIQQGRMAINGEARNKRKGFQGLASEEASDPMSAPCRQKMSMGGMLRAFRGHPRPFAQHPSEADSSEGSEEPREPE